MGCPRKGQGVGVSLPPSARDRAGAEGPIILTKVGVPETPPLEPELRGEGHHPSNPSIWCGDVPEGRVPHAELPLGCRRWGTWVGRRARQQGAPREPSPAAPGK